MLTFSLHSVITKQVFKIVITAKIQTVISPLFKLIVFLYLSKQVFMLNRTVIETVFLFDHDVLRETCYD